MYIDQSVYPDLPAPPDALPTIEDKADYVHRVCSSWDFHVHPEPETFEVFADWKEIFDRFPIPTSPAYHAFRAWFGWEPVHPIPGLIGPVPMYQHLDRLEGREDDACATMI